MKIVKEIVTHRLSIPCSSLALCCCGVVVAVVAMDGCLNRATLIGCEVRPRLFYALRGQLFPSRKDGG